MLAICRQAKALLAKRARARLSTRSISRWTPTGAPSSPPYRNDERSRRSSSATSCVGGFTELAAADRSGRLRELLSQPARPAQAPSAACPRPGLAALADVGAAPADDDLAGSPSRSAGTARPRGGARGSGPGRRRATPSRWRKSSIDAPPASIPAASASRTASRSAAHCAAVSAARPRAAGGSARGTAPRRRRCCRRPAIRRWSSRNDLTGARRPRASARRCSAVNAGSNGSTPSRAAKNASSASAPSDAARRCRSGAGRTKRSRAPSSKPKLDARVRRLGRRRREQRAGHPQVHQQVNVVREAPDRGTCRGGRARSTRRPLQRRRRARRARAARTSAGRGSRSAVSRGPRRAARAGGGSSRPRAARAPWVARVAPGSVVRPRAGSAAQRRHARVAGTVLDARTRVGPAAEARQCDDRRQARAPGTGCRSELCLGWDEGDTPAVPLAEGDGRRCTSRPRYDERDDSTCGRSPCASSWCTASGQAVMEGRYTDEAALTPGARPVAAGAT